MFLMRHVQIHDGQRHEDERLQRDDQDMEDGPAQLQHTGEASYNFV